MSYVPPDSFGEWRRPSMPWYRRLLIWLGLRPQPLPNAYRRPVYAPDPPPPRMEVLDIHELRFESPALGDAFNFNITVRCTWQGQTNEADRQRLQQQVLEQKQEVAGQIETAVRRITRRHPPQACAEAERTINEELPHSWPVDGICTITCQVQVAVGLDPAIRDLRRETDLRGIRVDGEREATRQQVERLREEVMLWHGLLGEWAGDQTTSDAVVLTLRPGELENIAGRPSGPLDPEREHLIAQANRWLADISRHGLEETVFGFDSALLALIRHLGIPLPARTGNGKGPGDRAEDAPGGSTREGWDNRQDGEGAGTVAS